MNREIGDEFGFGVPFIRWADTVRVPQGGHGAFERQLYDHEWVYVLEGTGEFVVDGRKFEVFPDALFLITPRAWHSYLARAEPQRLLGVHFDWQPRADCAGFDTHRPAIAPFEESLFRAPQTPRFWPQDVPFLDLRGRPRARFRVRPETP